MRRGDGLEDADGVQRRAPDITKVATGEPPGVTFDSARREPHGGFAARGKDKTGKVLAWRRPPASKRDTYAYIHACRVERIPWYAKLTAGVVMPTPSAPST